jgi:hypothetical protein
MVFNATFNKILARGMTRKGKVVKRIDVLTELALKVGRSFDWFLQVSHREVLILHVPVVSHQLIWLILP